MPSPVGHILGGIATAWAADLIPGDRAWRTGRRGASLFRRSGGTLTVACGVLGALADADLLFGIHRTGSHSLVAAFLVAIVAAAVTGLVTSRNSRPVARPTRPVGPSDSRAAATDNALKSAAPGKGRVLRIALMCGAAYASHLLLDWLAVDHNPPFGFQLLWPFSESWFISGLDFFPETERRRFFSWPSIRTNLTAVSWEAVTLLPILAALWLIRVKALARFSAQLAGRDHSP